MGAFGRRISKIETCGKIYIRFELLEEEVVKWELLVEDIVNGTLR